VLEFDNDVLHVGSFLAVTFGIFVLFVGKRLNDAIGTLREFSIPEPVTGGLLLSLLLTLVYALSGVEVDFELDARDFLLVYFFTTIGINASVGDLMAGGRPLLRLLLADAGRRRLRLLALRGARRGAARLRVRRRLAGREQRKRCRQTKRSPAQIPTPH